jgi:hypothetical protein
VSFEFCASSEKRRSNQGVTKQSSAPGVVPTAHHVYIDWFQWQAYNGPPDIGMFNMETPQTRSTFANDYPLKLGVSGVTGCRRQDAGKEKATMERQIAAGVWLQQEVAADPISRMALAWRERPGCGRRSVAAGGCAATAQSWIQRTQPGDGCYREGEPPGALALRRPLLLAALLTCGVYAALAHE